MTDGVRLHGAEFRYDGGEAVLTDVTHPRQPRLDRRGGAQWRGQDHAAPDDHHACTRGHTSSACVLQRVDDMPTVRCGGWRRLTNARTWRTCGGSDWILWRWIDGRRCQPVNASGGRSRGRLACATPTSLRWMSRPIISIKRPLDNWCGTMLQRFRGVGLLVSHDRALLDAVTTSTVLVDHRTAQGNSAAPIRRSRHGVGGGRPLARVARTRRAPLNRQRRVAAQVSAAQRHAASAAAAVNASSRIKGTARLRSVDRSGPRRWPRGPSSKAGETWYGGGVANWMWPSLHWRTCRLNV